MQVSVGIHDGIVPPPMSDRYKTPPTSARTVDSMTTSPAARVGMITIDAPDASVLARFYADLLDLEVMHDGDGYAMIGREGTTPIGFGTDPDLTPPSWPDHGRKQFHLDVAATDPSATVARALELGASRPDDQPGGDRWTVLIDPAGHPFCVTDAGNWG
jgi:catechol 2,3-dioxygenase-like lactoylglutathione lyase family enzyme